MNKKFIIKEFEGFETLGLSNIITRSQKTNYSIVRNLWNKFNSDIHKINGYNSSSESWEKYGITYKTGEDYFYMAAIKKSDVMIIPSGMITKEICSGNYACFVHTGNMDAIKTTVYNIFKTIIPETSLIVNSAENVGLILFEKYDSRFRWNSPDSILEIYVPVKP